jgi:hypothetical protein
MSKLTGKQLEECSRVLLTVAKVFDRVVDQANQEEAKRLREIARAFKAERIKMAAQNVKKLTE